MIKRIVFILLVSFCLLSPVASAVTVSNLNTGFETGTLASWGNSDATLSTDIFHAGSKAARLNGLGGQVNQTITGIIGNGTVAYDFWIYKEHAASIGSFQFFFYDAHGALLSSTAYTTLGGTTTTWVQKTGSFPVPTGTTSMKMQITCNTNTADRRYVIDDAVFTYTSVSPDSSGYIGVDVKDEKTGVNIQNFNITLTNSTTAVSETVTTGAASFNLNEISTGEYIAQVSASGYQPRTCILISPYVGTLYLPDETDAVGISFSLIDYTNLFNYRDTVLKVMKPTPGGNINISSNYFDVAGTHRVYLLPGDSYTLELVSSKATRSVGAYTVTQSEAVSLVVGDIPVIPETTSYGGFAYNITKTNTTVTFAWNDQNGALTGNVNYTIYDSAGTAVYNINSASATGSGSYTYADPSEQYQIVLSVPTSAGTISHSEYVTGDNQVIDLQISAKWYNMLSIFAIFIVGLTFGAKSAPVGAAITGIMTAGFYLVGLLQISGLVVSMIVILGLIAVMRGR